MNNSKLAPLPLTKQNASERDARQWNFEETGTFKAVLQIIPLGTNAGDICSKVRAALKVQKSRKSIDQVTAKYYHLVKRLVDLLGKDMPPRPHKQSYIQRMLLEHWDQITCAKERRNSRKRKECSTAAAPQPQIAAASSAVSHRMASHPGAGSQILHDSAAASAAPCGQSMKGSGSQVQQVSQQQGAAAAALQQPAPSWALQAGPHLAPHDSSGQLVLGVPEPQTPAETPPQLSRHDTAEALPRSQRASPAQQAGPGPHPAQQGGGMGQASDSSGAQSSQEGQPGVSKPQEGQDSMSFKARAPAGGRKAPKLALRVVPLDPDTAVAMEQEGLPAYFELSCRGHKTMTDLAAALESQWGDTRKHSGQRMTLWSAKGGSSAPVLCWGPYSASGIMVHAIPALQSTDPHDNDIPSGLHRVAWEADSCCEYLKVGDIYRSLGQPQPFALSYTLEGPDLHEHCRGSPAAAEIAEAPQQAAGMAQAAGVPGSGLLAPSSEQLSQQPVHAAVSLEPHTSSVTAPLQGLKPVTSSEVSQQQGTAALDETGPDAPQQQQKRKVEAHNVPQTQPCSAVVHQQNTRATKQRRLLAQRVDAAPTQAAPNSAAAGTMHAAPPQADNTYAAGQPLTFLGLLDSACAVDAGHVPCPIQGSHGPSRGAGTDRNGASAHATGNSEGFISLFGLGATCDGFGSRPAAPNMPASMDRMPQAGPPASQKDCNMLSRPAQKEAVPVETAQDPTGYLAAAHQELTSSGKDTSQHECGMQGGAAAQQGQLAGSKAQRAAQEATPAIEGTQSGASLSSLGLLGQGATCSGFDTAAVEASRPGASLCSLGLFRPGTACSGFESSFSELFGRQHALTQDTPAAPTSDAAAKSAPEPITDSATVARKRAVEAHQGSKDRGIICGEAASAGEHTNSRGSRSSAGAYSQEEPLSFAGFFSKRKQPSRLGKKAAGTGSKQSEEASKHEQLPKGSSKPQSKRSSKRKQQEARATANEASQPGARRKRQAKLPGGIFSEQTLAGLADGIPAHPSTATQLPAMARADLTDDLPDDLPAEPLVFWSSTMLANLPEQTPQASKAPAPLEDFQLSQLGSLLGNGNSWDAPACTGSAAAGACFCTERPFAELFAQEMI